MKSVEKGQKRAKELIQDISRIKNPTSKEQFRRYVLETLQICSPVESKEFLVKVREHLHYWWNDPEDRSDYSYYCGKLIHVLEDAHNKALASNRALACFECREYQRNLTLEKDAITAGKRDLLQPEDLINSLQNLNRSAAEIHRYQRISRENCSKCEGLEEALSPLKLTISFD